MSATNETSGAAPSDSVRGLSLRQTLAVARLEIWRNFLGLRALGLYLLAGLPVALVLLFAWGRMTFGGDTLPSAGDLSREFGAFYGQLFARLVIFFVCLLVFTRLFRAEIQERSLHYSFLAPVRRELLVAGKFLAGFVAVGLVLSLAVIGSFLLHFLPLTLVGGSGGYGAFLLRGGGLGQLAGYLAVTLLGVLGYGAVFLASGIFFRNPILPALVVFGWEWANFLLPPVLKRISVIHYLQALQPVPPPEGVLALLATPPSPWLAVPGVLLVSAALLALSAWRLRHFEIAYGEE
jgi:ABC-type transport system involved in multi-copper enzyme maturation permease subunit